METAKAAGRTGFGQMIALLKKAKTCKTVLVEKTDRLYRNLKDWVLSDELGLEVHFVKENVILSPESRSSEKFMHGIKVLMAKNYIDNLSEEVRKGLHQKAREGMWPSFAPLGYLNVDGPDGRKVIIPDPEMAPAIARMFERYATGKYSLKEVATLARADGLAYRKSGNPVPTSTVHKILRKRTYCGDYDYHGTVYHGTYEPIISVELWDQVQAVLEGRHLKRPKKRKHDFAFSGLIECGHCGHALVGDLKKGRYVYYHCTGHEGKCPEPYTREEMLEKAFTRLLEGISFSEEVLARVTRALRESHRDAMYMDKLDGRIDNDFFDRKAAEFRTEQGRLTRDIQAHQGANQSYIEDGVKILELAHRAAQLFESQPPSEKRKLLNFVLSNCIWKGGKLQAAYRKPFDLIALAVAGDRNGEGGNGPKTGNFDSWR